MTANLNDQIRARGNRSRALPDIPDIGQSAGAVVQQMQSQSPNQPPSSPNPNPMAAPSPAAAPAAPQPAAQGNPFVIHPPGQTADPAHYNYEPQNDGSWRVYPPGVQAPAGAFTTSMPRAASTADYARMSQALAQSMYGG